MTKKPEGTAKRNFPPISIRFEPKIREVIVQLAKEESRSSAQWIEMYITKHMKADGLLPSDKANGDVLT